MYKTRLKILQRIQVGELAMESPKTNRWILQEVGKDCRKCWRIVERFTFCLFLEQEPHAAQRWLYLSRLPQSSLVSPEYCILFHCIILKGYSFYAM